MDKYGNNSVRNTFKSLERLESNPDTFKVFSRGNQNLSSLQISSKIITNKCPRHSIQNILFKNYKIDQNLLPDFVKKKNLLLSSPTLYWQRKITRNISACRARIFENKRKRVNSSGTNIIVFKNSQV